MKIGFSHSLLKIRKLNLLCKCSINRIEVILQIESFQTQAIVTILSSSPFPSWGRHFQLTGCLQIGPKPQIKKVESYKENVDRTSSFWSIFRAYWIPLMDCSIQASWDWHFFASRIPTCTACCNFDIEVKNFNIGYDIWRRLQSDALCHILPLSKSRLRYPTWSPKLRYWVQYSEEAPIRRYLTTDIEGFASISGTISKPQNPYS